MKPKKQYLFLSVLFFLLAFWLFSIENRLSDERIADVLSPNILRFHILAASDRHEDQELKLKVRDYFLDILRAAVPSDADKATILSYIHEEKNALETSVNAYIRQNGCSDTCRIQTATVHFPKRTYGNLVFPCGDYEALQILIGAAKGHNWWCVLYPSLCFTEESGPCLPETSCKLLKEMAGEETYQTMLTEAKTAVNTQFYIQKPLQSLCRFFTAP